MKRVILVAGLLIGTFAIADAQTHKKTSHTKTTKYTSTSSHAAKGQKMVKHNEKSIVPENKQVVIPSSTDPSKLDPRKIYMWEDGQSATPSGHQARAVNGNKVSKENIDMQDESGQIVNPYLVNPALLNQAKMYMWRDGQAATPTGHEASSVTGGYAALGKKQ
jgi:hypothetical protein